MVARLRPSQPAAKPNPAWEVPLVPDPVRRDRATAVVLQAEFVAVALPGPDQTREAPGVRSDPVRREGHLPCRVSPPDRSADCDLAHPVYRLLIFLDLDLQDTVPIAGLNRVRIGI